MKVFENMEQYTEWFMKDAVQLTRNAFYVVKVKSIDKVLCVCSTPELIESIAEEAAYAFIRRWNEEVACANDDEVTMNEDAELDFVAVVRDKVLEVFQDEKNMEIVFVSTEY